MPNRIIKDSINESRGLTSCSFFAQDLYKRLITYADDYGRFNADPQIMVARLYPRELSVVSTEDLIEGLIDLVGVGKIKFYTSSARKEVYGCFPHWEDHQRIRDSKKRIPDPEDTTVNDWYLRRYISIEMKVAIVQRDGFKCKVCGKHIAEMTDAHKLVKMASGSFHIDHIVPCNQGGRATMENLRLLCPKCNLSRKKTFSYEEILAFGGEEQKTAAGCGEMPQSAPVIQSNPNPNTNPIVLKTRAGARERASKKSEFSPPSLEDVRKYCAERNSSVDAKRFWDYFEVGGWVDANGQPVRNWKQKLITWESKDMGSAVKTGRNAPPAGNWPETPPEGEMDRMAEMLRRMGGGG